MGRQNLNSKTEGERHEEKSRVVSQIRQSETWATTCIKKLITWQYDIRF